MGELPQQMQANLATLENLNTQLRLNSDNQIRAAERRDSLSALLAEAALVRPGFGAAPGPTATEPRAVRLTRLRQELASARARYTEEHPTVVRLKAEIAATEREPPRPLRRAGPGRGRSSRRAPTSCASARRSVPSSPKLKILKAEEQHLRAAIAIYQARVENTPKREQEFQELSRDYDATKQLYDPWSSGTRRRSSPRAWSSGRRASSSASSTRPSRRRPGRAEPAAGCSPMGLRPVGSASAAAALMLAEMLDTSFHSVDELRAFTTVPVLVEHPADRDRGRPAARPPAVPAGGGRGGAGAGPYRRRLLLRRPRQRAPRPLLARGGSEAPMPSTSPSSGSEQGRSTRRRTPASSTLTPGIARRWPSSSTASRSARASCSSPARSGRARRRCSTRCSAGWTATPPWPSCSTRRCRSTGSSSTCSRISVSPSPGESHAQRLLALNTF